MTTHPRFTYRFDPDHGQWIVRDKETFQRVGAFDSLYEVEHWICSDAVLDLDEPAEVET